MSVAEVVKSPRKKKKVQLINDDNVDDNSDGFSKKMSVTVIYLSQTKEPRNHSAVSNF